MGRSGCVMRTCCGPIGGSKEGVKEGFNWCHSWVQRREACEEKRCS